MPRNGQQRERLHALVNVLLETPQQLYRFAEAGKKLHLPASVRLGDGR
jgi:hypothetical protein